MFTPVKRLNSTSDSAFTGVTGCGSCAYAAASDWSRSGTLTTLEVEINQFGRSYCNHSLSSLAIKERLFPISCTSNCPRSPTAMMQKNIENLRKITYLILISLGPGLFEMIALF